MQSVIEDERDTSQQSIIAFLSSPEAFDDEYVERIDTHISHVFLVGDRAYKLKRAVKFEFLDFSTPDLRERACRREIEINKRFSPSLYLDVIPITQLSNGKLELGGLGTPVDWLVEIKRFDRNLQLDALARERKLTMAMMSRLADGIAAMHKSAPYSLKHGGSQEIRGISLYIAKTLRSAPDGHVDNDALRSWSTSFRKEVKRQAPLLNHRRRLGFVRHCHADLHLANLVLLNDEPTPFDAIEFNDDISWVDVLYDIGFTIMDLLHYGERRLANLLLNRYLEVTRDYTGLSLLPLFISLRAAIRAMATAVGKDTKTIDASKNYLNLAGVSLQLPQPPVLIAVAGISGTGKSTLARSLAVELVGSYGAIVLNSDAIRKRMHGVSLDSRLQLDAYSSDVSSRVYRRLLTDAKHALEAEQTVIVDATFLDPNSRHSLEKLSDDLDIPLFGLWLEAPRVLLQERLAKRANDVSDADFSVAQKQMENVVVPQNWHRIDSSGGPNTALEQSIYAIGN